MGKPEEDGGGTSWRGFSCPGCHTLFRVPGDSTGKRVECPACGEVSLIPARKESPPQGRRPPEPNKFRQIAELAGRAEGLGAARRRVESGPRSAQDGSAQSDAAGSGIRRVRRKVKKKKSADTPNNPDWDREGRPIRSSRRRSGRRNPVLVGVVIVLVLVLAGAVWINRGGGVGTTGEVEQGSPSARPPGDGTIEPGGPAPQPAGAGSSDASETVAGDSELAKVEMRTTLEAIERAVGEFLGAKSVAEMARVVREGDAMLPRMTDYYRRVPFAPTSYRKIAPQGKVLKSGDLWSVDVVLEDFSLRPIAIEKTDGGCLVDWESWVGYSELPWSEFLARKPTEPKLFRVLCTAVDYYNFDFDDDRKWQSYQLESPDGEYTLYGYVPRYSPMGRILQPAGGIPEDRPQAVLVKLRFPDEGTGPNQVLIDEVVNSGWIAPPE